MAGLTKEKIDRIRKLTSKGYSLKEVAQKAEASPKTVSKYAGNIAKPKRETLENKIELYFAIALDAMWEHQAVEHGLSDEDAHHPIAHPLCPYCQQVMKHSVREIIKDEKWQTSFKCPDCAYETKPLSYP